MKKLSLVVVVCMAVMFLITPAMGSSFFDDTIMDSVSVNDDCAKSGVRYEKQILSIIKDKGSFEAAPGSTKVACVTEEGKIDEYTEFRKIACKKGVDVFLISETSTVKCIRP